MKAIEQCFLCEDRVGGREDFVLGTFVLGLFWRKNQIDVVKLFYWFANLRLRLSFSKCYLGALNMIKAGQIMK